MGDRGRRVFVSSSFTQRGCFGADSPWVSVLTRLVLAVGVLIAGDTSESPPPLGLLLLFTALELAGTVEAVLVALAPAQ